MGSPRASAALAASPIPLGFSLTPEDEYHRDRAFVRTGWLKTAITRSYAAARHEIEQPPASTPALQFGAAFHRAIAGLPVPVFTGDARTKAGKAERDSLLTEFPGVPIMSGADGAAIMAMRDSVMAHPVIGRLLETRGTHEMTGAAINLETHVPVKARFDWVGAGVIIDWKTCTDAAPPAFTRAVAAYRYHLQAALYTDVYRAITGDPPKRFLFCAVEKTAPHCCAVYELDEAARAVGNAEYRAALRKWRECAERGEWPGLPLDILTISLPGWALNAGEIME